MHQMNIRLPEKIYKRLGDLAKKTGRTRTYYVKHAIVEYLEDLEDTALAMSALEEHHRSGDKVYSLAEVEKILDLDD